jgi:glycosyltransferase involved in cell wall biosynthesis
MPAGTAISVILLSCDRPSWCEIALRSVLAQTHAEFEVLVRDDSVGSAIETLVSSIGDARVRYRRGQRAGQLANFVGALDETTGDVVLVLHDDDWWEPTLLARVATPMLADPAVDFATTPFTYVDAKGSVLNEQTRLRERSSARPWPSGIVELASVEERARELIVRRLVSPFQGTAIRRRVLDNLDLPDEAGSVLDLWISAHLAKTTTRWLFVTEHLVFYRVHGGSVASAMNDLQSERWVIEAFLADPELSPLHARRGARPNRSR